MVLVKLTTDKLREKTSIPGCAGRKAREIGRLSTCGSRCLEERLKRRCGSSRVYEDEVAQLVVLHATPAAAPFDNRRRCMGLNRPLLRGDLVMPLPPMDKQRNG
jgi:hypothetical protein